METRKQIKWAEPHLGVRRWDVEFLKISPSTNLFACQLHESDSELRVRLYLRNNISGRVSPVNNPTQFSSSLRYTSSSFSFFLFRDKRLFLTWPMIYFLNAVFIAQGHSSSKISKNLVVSWLAKAPQMTSFTLISVSLYLKSKLKNFPITVSSFSTKNEYAIVQVLKRTKLNVDVLSEITKRNYDYFSARIIGISRWA